MTLSSRRVKVCWATVSGNRLCSLFIEFISVDFILCLFCKILNIFISTYVLPTFPLLSTYGLIYLRTHLPTNSSTYELIYLHSLLPNTRVVGRSGTQVRWECYYSTLLLLLYQDKICETKHLWNLYIHIWGINTSILSLFITASFVITYYCYTMDGSWIVGL